jgi:hypothetical protein
LIHAEQYYDQYNGIAFVPEEETDNYIRQITGYIQHDGTNDAVYFCPVTFNVPDGSTFFIKSIGMLYRDNLTDGYIKVRLRRKNLYTCIWHEVATWQSDYASAVSSPRTASQGTNVGYKLVDTKKFSYWLVIQFERDGDVAPGTDLQLHQVRIHYGT